MVGCVKLKTIPSLTSLSPQPERFVTLLHGISKQRIANETTRLKSSKLIEAIESVTQRVSELEGVEGVRHTFNGGDIHRVTFQIKNNCESSESLWKVAQSLIVETCMNLRDATKERWYFYTELVEDFNENIFDF
ncbi:hypothetical protein LC653_13500 [Nostoc sp. CHAB 5784]|uniref:hypothetical protein n=1 Tax=Nostoc mirabile TaxID=2907820 RepID=UPI001E5254AE|nr:hypothetical protein [Nostoc mirabile]MCC5664908.1 hypothetical protein [Nostoc mirabile CHAB5784]